MYGNQVHQATLKVVSLQNRDHPKESNGLFTGLQSVIHLAPNVPLALSSYPMRITIY